MKEVDITGLKNYIQHSNFSRLEHCLAVAYVSFIIAKKANINVNYHDLIRGALLHDFYFYDWHKKDESPRLHGYVHAKIAMINAIRKVKDLNDKEKNIIYSHMWPLNLTHLPLSKEAAIVCIADKYCASYEVLFKEKSIIPSKIKKFVLS